MMISDSVDFEALGFVSGETAARRDGAVYDSIDDCTYNGLNQMALSELAENLAPDIVRDFIDLRISAQPYLSSHLEHDEMFQHACEQFIKGFKLGYQMATL